MRTVNIHPTETQFSELADEASLGEEIIIAKAGKPVARLMPLEIATAPKRRLGGLKGKLVVPPETYEPWPDDFIDLFYRKE